MIPKHVIEFLDEARRQGTVVRTKGGADLDLTRQEFEQYMLVESDGLELLGVLESGVWRDAEQYRFIKGYSSPQGVRFIVPSWEKLVSFLRNVKNGTSLGDSQ